MSNTPRAKMSIENRAKQFAPFVGQPGLYEALARVEAEVELSCLFPEGDKHTSSSDNTEHIASANHPASEFSADS